MTIKLAMLLTADANQAKAELVSTGKVAEGTGKAVEKMGRKGKSAAAGTKALGTSAGVATSKVRQLSIAEAQNAATVGKMGAANKMAAGNVGNLVAQFNDVGVMMAAGQNPLQLALQQGTQITQVIGPMGAAGAVKALGAALVQMVNPVSLITIGSIAAGAAMVGWLTDGGEAALTLEERIDNLTDGIDNYRTSVKNAGLDTDAMLERFGSGATEAKKYLDALIEVRRREALVGASQVAESMTGSHGSYRQFAQQSDIGEEFGLHISGTGRKIGRELVGELVLAYEEIDATATASIDKQVGAWQRTYDATVKAAEAVGGVSQSENERLGLIAEQVLRLQELMALDEASARAAEAALTTQREKFSEWVTGVYEYAAAKVQINLQELGTAQQMLQSLNEENAIKAAILKHGSDSLETAELRAAAERRVFENVLDTLDVSAELKDELRTAFERGQDLANLDMTSGIGAAANEASKLAGWLGVSLETAGRLASMGPQGVPTQQGGRGGDPRKFGGSSFDWQNRAGTEFLENYKPSRPSRGGAGAGAGGGTGEVQKERDAIKKLTQSLQDELAILRETDPVQKEMLKNREALAGATAVERQSIADLIAQRNAETMAVEQQKEQWDFLKDTTYGALDSLILQGSSLADVMDNVADSIASAALQAILLGEGPLANLLGGAGGGGIIGMLVDAIKPVGIPANAAGGMIYGRGSGKSDDVLMYGSSGEFMVNASATKKHRGLLEMINAGNPTPGFAAGGFVAPGYMSGRGGGGGGFAPAHQTIIENHSSAQIIGEVKETVDASGRRRSRLVLADAVGDALTAPGGGAKRVMKKQYGLRTAGALR